LKRSLLSRKKQGLEIGGLSYFFLWLNAVSAVLMYQYMHSSAFHIGFLLPSMLSGLGYYLGYRFALTGKPVPRIPFLLVFVIYSGLFALPVMSRFLWMNFHAAHFANECGRLLAFRACWFSKRSEAYFHLLLYLIIVCTCFGHYRADVTLLVFLPLHILVMYFALFSLYRDSLSDKRMLSVSNSILGVLGVVLVTVLLVSVLPAKKLWDFQIIPEKHRFYLAGEFEVPLGKTESLKIAFEKGLTANESSGFSKVIHQMLFDAYSVGAAISLPRINYWLVLACFLFLILIFLLYKKGKWLCLAIQVKYIDPWRILFIYHKKKHSVKHIESLFGVYERLWRHLRVPRKLNETPVEHLHKIALEKGEMIKSSLLIVQCMQDVVYGTKQIDNISEPLRCYLDLRSVIAPDVSYLFE